MDTTETLREDHERILARIQKFEEEKAEYLARGESVPQRITHNLKMGAIELDEVRLHGHRAAVREIEEGQREAALRDMRDRMEAERKRIHDAPPLDPADLRRKRKELGATQQQLATFSGVGVKTIGRIEDGFRRYQPKTLQLISAGLESFAKFRARAAK
jgi:DNA-binding XRE family transcriptional regulator